MYTLAPAGSKVYTYKLGAEIVVKLGGWEKRKLIWGRLKSGRLKG